VPIGFTDGIAPVVNNGPRTGNEVALTFDADMTPGMATHLHSTPGVSYANLKVISTLESRHIPATFFITGMWAVEYPQVLIRLAGNPDFEFGNHTWTHRAVTSNCYNLPVMSDAELTDEVLRTFQTVRAFGGHQTNYFRFPGLCHDAAALAALAPDHVTVIDGDVISGDPGATSAAPIVSAVLHRVKPGSIVIMHITEDNARFTDEALPQILDGLASKGLQPVRLSQLLGASSPPSGNGG
jgi:peptidoglycan/xylan/chitin deacetylase (PgdA/CDA1 family)